MNQQSRLGTGHSKWRCSNWARELNSLVLICVTLLVPPAALFAEQDTIETPRLEHVLTVRATIEDTVEMGKTPHGVRRVVPIRGGTFEGPSMRGVIMPGGEDWQLLREDGVLELDARYWLRTEDGALIRVHNQVLSVPPAQGAAPTTRYARSSVRFEAPIGKYEWLNKAIFVGTITPDLRQRPPVIVLQFFKVN
jgi:Protein of unknown function (DUF3237)